MLMIEINYSATVKKEQMIEFDIIIPHAEQLQKKCKIVYSR